MTGFGGFQSKKSSGCVDLEKNYNIVSTCWLLLNHYYSTNAI